MFTQDEIKQQLGIYAADFIKNDMLIGLGTGTTVYYLLKELGKRKQQGLNFTAVCTSLQTQNILKEEGMNFISLDYVDRLQLAIDGADEVDENGSLIKGGGGALLQEKIVEAAADELIIIVDEKKNVKTLGAFPLPVEVITFGWKQVKQKIESAYNIKTRLREKDGKVYLTDHQHYILDCFFNTIPDPGQLNNDLHLMPGVVETGLFVDMANKIITGHSDGSITVRDI
ncbi:ribose-5-phosphate isomerase RpiA [Parafilimonas terrae]|jgi:ribose 5-phosphate isomerase A|uniref:Ribose-5-phosphate isomerase A n=1 Tax=Parafilimonas terrae TaxID=1465490 RepID=A0A1I5RFH0_9BACT|nr:ribose-5-phosphate isomerase RpiA [Parafilimonas terrae]SFP57077.1 ribose-5-phosphate isomerase [Parafilimonas terrae]